MESNKVRISQALIELIIEDVKEKISAYELNEDISKEMIKKFEEELNNMRKNLIYESEKEELYDDIDEFAEKIYYKDKETLNEGNFKHFNFYCCKEFHEGESVLVLDDNKLKITILKDETFENHHIVATARLKTEDKTI